jgi:hypothetical protein
MRAFDIGDKVICNGSCVVGRVIRFYKPTACEEQTLVYLEDGRRYHAPTSEWVKYKDGLEPKLMVFDEVAGIPWCAQHLELKQELLDIRHELFTFKLNETLKQRFGG